MIIKAVIIGHNQWDEYTYPLIESMQKYASAIELYVVDNGSDPGYPQIGGYTLVRSNNHSVARAINAGMRSAEFADWYMILDNDTICTASFLPIFSTLDENVYYGAEIKDWEVCSYVVGWCRLMSSKLFSVVGSQDERFAPWGYTDVDYSYRAVQAGFKIEQIDLPFEHMKHGSHKYLGDVEKIRERNQRLFLDKHGLSLPDE